MPRINGVEKPQGLLQRIAFWFSKRYLGRVVTPLRVMARHPRVLAANLALERKLLAANTLPEEVKHLVVLRVAQLIACPFCVDIGTSLNLQAGASAEKIKALPVWQQSPLFSEAERLCLDFAEAVTRLPLQIDEANFAQLRARFSDVQIIELAEFVALENKRSRFNHALGIKSDGFTDGALCYIPPAHAVQAAA